MSIDPTLPKPWAALLRTPLAVDARFTRERLAHRQRTCTPLPPRTPSAGEANPPPASADGAAHAGWVLVPAGCCCHRAPWGSPCLGDGSLASSAVFTAASAYLVWPVQRLRR